MEHVKIPMTHRGVATTMDVGPRFWGAPLPGESTVPPVKWYRWQFHAPSLVRIVGVSFLFPAITPLIASARLKYSSYVGVYLFLLCLAVLLPLAFRTVTASGAIPFPVAPFVGINLMYFVLATLVPLAYPDTVVANISLPALPATILLLTFGFGLFAAGMIMSGRMLKTWFSQPPSVVAVRSMGALVVATAGVVWIMRLYSAANGFGLLHLSGVVMSGLPQRIRAVVVAAGEIEYVPVCLCLTRLCNSSLPAEKLRVWQTYLAIILVSDVFYFLMIGSRLSLLSEFLIILWVMWLRLVPMFSRRWYAYTGLVLALTVPVNYAQRAVLQHRSPHAGENQLIFIRNYLVHEQVRVLEESPVLTLGRGLNTDLGRLTAIAPV